VEKEGVGRKRSRKGRGQRRRGWESSTGEGRKEEEERVERESRREEGGGGREEGHR
jgi:hypothetical protein